MRVQQKLWDQTDLVGRLCRVLDVARQAVKQLAGNGFLDPEEPGNNIIPEKIIAETALLLLAASTVNVHDEVNIRIQGLAEILIPYARSERMLLGMCLRPSLALDYAHAHIFLEKLGYPDPQFETLLSEIARSHAFAGRERVPHRMLEQDWVTRLQNNSGKSARRGSRQTIRNSALGQPMDLLHGSRDDVYAFTHAMMYARNFNLSERLSLPRGRCEILAEAEAALARSLDEEDYDLSGELLLSWPLTGTQWSGAATFGFRVLTAVEDAAGFLPAPGTRMARLQKLEGQQRTNYFLATAYHTIYVMGLLCAMALQPGRTPPVTIPASAAVSRKANLILPALDGDDPNPHWHNEFNKLTEPERDGLTGFLLNVALRRKAVQRDFSAVRDLLILAEQLGLTNTPIAGQAAEMLGHLSIFADVRQVRTDPSVCLMQYQKGTEQLIS